MRFIPVLRKCGNVRRSVAAIADKLCLFVHVLRFIPVLRKHGNVHCSVAAIADKLCLFVHVLPFRERVCVFVLMLRRFPFKLVKL